MSEQTNALHLARSRILKLEEALGNLVSFIDEIADGRRITSLRVADFRTSIGPNSKAIYEAARSVLNKENGNG